jgi:hypothetical protein
MQIKPLDITPHLYGHRSLISQVQNIAPTNRVEFSLLEVEDGSERGVRPPWRPGEMAAEEGKKGRPS